MPSLIIFCFAAAPYFDSVLKTTYATLMPDISAMFVHHPPRAAVTICAVPYAAFSFCAIIIVPFIMFPRCSRSPQSVAGI